MATFIRCLLGPKLYRQHRNGRTGQGADYIPHPLERHSDRILGWASVMWSITYYSCPLLLLTSYRKGHFFTMNYEKVIETSGYLTCVTIFLVGVFCARGIGRYQNPDYVNFIAVLSAAKRNRSEMIWLNDFDFDFRSRPVDFRWNERQTREEASRHGVASLQEQPRQRTLFKRLSALPLRLLGVEASRHGVTLLKEQPRQRTLFERLSALLLQLLGAIVVRTFGRRLVFPGSLGLLQNSIWSQLHEGRAKLVEEFRGRRAKLQACDGNDIDCMFVDRRGTRSAEGGTLVICCEGNAGFYEIGCMATPLQGNYSVLGWNHPGFASSTGVPGPQTEANAMDVVLNFAIHELRFDIDIIFIYAWSIGGFTATWAAMSYPEIAGLVLDASFDNLVPLALKVMPEGWRSLVVLTVKEHMNLNNCEQLCKYPGPVLLIRRTLDEVISLVPEDPRTNRGNELLMRLMKHRYPNLMVEKSCQVLLGWLAFGKPSNEAQLYSQVVVSEEWCSSTLRYYVVQEGDTYPCALGSDFTDDQKNQMVIFLAKRYMKNVNMSHCTPLPASDFALPKHAGIILSVGSTGH